VPSHEEVDLKPALLVIDVQKAFFDFSPFTAQSLHDAIEYINPTIALFRAKGLPVVAVQQLDPSENLVPGQSGFDCPAELKLLPSDLHIHKTYGNAFNRTPLEEALRQQGVDTVILTGYCAEYCVHATYVGAQDRDFAAMLLRDAVASSTPGHARLIESTVDLLSIGALTALLK
jgi:nicotinamidase-related amidase